MSDKHQNPFLLLGVILAITASAIHTGCQSERQIRIQRISEAVESLTDSRTRVVWIQDAGDNRDVFAHGDQLQLMAYDSHDGQGSRALLEEISHYSKPLITPNGNRVIFSNFHDKTVHISDFYGSSLKKLTDGMGLAVWQDPETGTEWVYVGRDRVDRRGTPYQTVYRIQIDDPDAEELVWDHRMVGADNFQLSADGRYASGVYPWPDAGVADLEDNSWSRLGRGCWPSMAPDNSNLFWIFEENHRAVSMFDTRNDRSSQVMIDTAPGIDGYEVYHPRWTNHPRFMTMTGPYKHRSGGNNIRGGGPDVEVYIGRFNGDFTEIEAWVRVTESERAAFYPDVWIESDSAMARNSEGIQPIGGSLTQDPW